MEKSRRNFLRKSLKIGAGAGAVGVVTSLGAKSDQKVGSGVVQGKAVKKEVLYHKSINWEKYYKIAY